VECRVCEGVIVSSVQRALVCEFNTLLSIVIGISLWKLIVCATKKFCVSIDFILWYVV
jgi:hypothetical protein